MPRISNNRRVDFVPGVQIKVGDLILIKNRESIPCDVLIMGVNEPNPQSPSGIAYVETKSLDGETNLKIRQVKKEGQKRALSSGKTCRTSAVCLLCKAHAATFSQMPPFLSNPRLFTGMLRFLHISDSLQLYPSSLTQGMQMQGTSRQCARTRKHFEKSSHIHTSLTVCFRKTYF